MLRLSVKKYLLNLGVAVFFLLRSVDCKTKTWLPDTSFSNIENWNPARIPCLTDTVVFPEDLNLPVILPPEEEVYKIILPGTGIIELPAISKLEFSGKTIHANCDGGTINYIRKGKKQWVDPDNWDGSNPATPHMERIPCITDEVVFPLNHSFSVELPSAEIKISSLELQGMKFYDSIVTYGRFNRPTAHSSFLVLADKCMENPKEKLDVGCECGNENLKPFVCSKYKNQHDLDCDNAIEPLGFCIPICGASLLYKIGNFSSVEAKVQAFAENEGIHSYTSRTHGFIQVVLVEDYYTGDIEDKAKKLNNILISSGSVSSKLNNWSIKTSGLRRSPVSASEAFVSFFVCFLLAGLTLFAIISYYNQGVVLDWNNFMSSFGKSWNGSQFARFENQSEVVQIGSNLEEPTEAQPTERSFANPMYSKNEKNEESIAFKELEKDIVDSEDSEEPTDTNDEPQTILL